MRNEVERDRCARCGVRIETVVRMRVEGRNFHVDCGLEEVEDRKAVVRVKGMEERCVLGEIE